VLQLNDLFFNGLIHKIVNHFDFDECSYNKWLFTNKFVGEFMSLLHGTFLYKKIVLALNMYHYLKNEYEI
jgi:hypothetical protein